MSDLTAVVVRNLYVISAMLHEERTGTELVVYNNCPENTEVWVRAYWKPDLAFKFWEPGKSLKEAWANWLEALSKIAETKIDVPDRFRRQPV